MAVGVLLYLMRHGAAEDTAPTGRDSDRVLTSSGRATVERVALSLKGMQTRPVAHIIASPFLRAQQTAEVVRRVLCPGVAIDTDEDLTPDGSAYDLAVRLGAAPQDTFLVGHQPNIEMVARAIMGGSVRMPAVAPLAPGVGSSASRRPVSPPVPRLPPTFRTATVVAFEVVGRPPPYPLVLALDPIALDG